MRDILMIFADQVRDARSKLQSELNDDERSYLYHRMNGSAKGVGAFQLATVAEMAENDPGNDHWVKEMQDALDAAEAAAQTLLQADMS
ncbi:MAG: hypothetical protein AAF590_07425 [Pseudomonadota bacterium]